ncbi:vacuolar protein sorting 33A-like protein [Annulohypoxylon truncatum]|uniref:vacuolar protein sorting 33A-like protein n=1 Tax=Annulohypoxylon truncatum TaxID=327061 RepID=UPI0020074D71|nr:vacuolar protein sorting 33A-like protein [Annulohypoxylon truncatum]KAI1213788.1 vacuolar protein sorting 33A-like protein [Annulohypoxylon truncatum]
MVPHAGFDPDQIRDKARKDLLYLLEGVRGKKNLVIERSLAGPIGVVVKVSTLQDYGVDKFFFLENGNADTSQRNVVFMARGECARHAQSIADQIKRLQRESQTGHEFHVFWVPRRTLVSDKLLEESGVLGDVNIAELPLYFFPLERDVLSLELDSSFQDLFLFKDTTPTFLMAKALMGIQSKHGLFPRVIGKGDNAKRVAELLTRMRQEILAGEDANEGTRSGLTPSNTIESAIIIDREVDFVTPLLTQLTYEGLIDEFWGIQNNQADIDSTIVGAPSQAASQSTASTPTPSTASRKRKIQLDSSDKLYDGLRDANFAIVGTLLNKVARRLQSDYDSRHTSKTTAELRDFVKKLPGYQTEHQSLKIHTGLAEEIMKHTRADQFSRMLEVQQNLAAGADPASQFDAIEELIARDVPLREILRLLCIYSCISGGIKSKDFDQFRRLVLEGYGYQHLLTLHNLEKLQLFLSRTSPMASMIPMPGSGTATGTKTNYTFLRKQLRLIVDEVNEHDPNDIAYVYSGYAPLSIRLVQCILQKQYLLSITRGNTGAGAGTAAGSGAQGWRGFDEAVKHARGQTFDELQKGEDKAVKARALLSGGSDKKTVFIVFVGGITFTEIAALRFIAKKEEARRNIVICTTSIISGNKMMDAAVEKDADITKSLPAALLTDSHTSYHAESSTSRETPRTESEIIVRIDDMDIDTDNMASITVSQDESTVNETPGNSFESPPSAISDRSELTSAPSTSSPSSKATTPVDVDTFKEPFLAHSAQTTTSIKSKRRTFDVRPRVSIPTDIAPHDYANQCIAAAESSRLNPYALHQDEYLMLRNHLSHAQVTTYLNIRNGILRLWLNNPRIGVSREEAIGCAKDPRWFDAANVCYDWLNRSGYINFGCVQVPLHKKQPKKINLNKKGKTVVVIGAGLAGLGCARHLETLFKQYAAEFQELGEEAPRVIVLEGRNRLGGRVYSRALDGSKSQHLIGFKGRRHSVECGGMIITGFERGNPLNVLLRGQMALPYYSLRPDTTLYDANGKAVDEKRDRLVEKLYNDCLERVSDYKFKNPPSKLIEGNKDLMDEGRDNRATGKTHAEPSTPATLKAAYKARLMGWTLKNNITEDHDLDLDAAAKAPNATLGSVMDEAITQYKDIVDLTPQDFRLMNWHIANLEYSNATNYNQLSIGGWDIDAGNEWEGKHTMVIGGYQSVPWALANTPSRLDIRKNTDVKRIFYDPEGLGTTRVESEDGTVVEADYVVSTIPLGVLKHGHVEFSPPLPSSKTDAIGRLGFGILNKIILVYAEAFWDGTKDIFGCLRTPKSRHSVKQAEYASQRGRCFQWFNVSNTSGIPVLIGLMAGDAGFDTEHSGNDELVAEATEVLRSVYGAKVPKPVHSIVTRWGSDKFARGSYSSAGPSMRPDDYQTMAKSIGNLFFAGEHTTETHPATVHGAYLTGLRAASEVINTMLGPIEVPTPLVLPKDSTFSSRGLKRKEPSDASLPLSPRSSKQARIDEYELAAWQHIAGKIGERPWRPQKVAANAYLLYSKTSFEVARKRCEEGRRPGKGKPSPNEVRVMTSKMWKEASPEERKPFEDQAAEIKEKYNESVKAWDAKVKEWDQQYLEIKTEYEKTHKLVLEDEGSPADDSGRERRRAKISNYAESEASDVDADMEG